MPYYVITDDSSTYWGDDESLLAAWCLASSDTAARDKTSYGFTQGMEENDAAVEEAD